MSSCFIALHRPSEERERIGPKVPEQEKAEMNKPPTTAIPPPPSMSSTTITRAPPPPPLSTMMNLPPPPPILPPGGPPQFLGEYKYKDLAERSSVFVQHRQCWKIMFYCLAAPLNFAFEWLSIVQCLLKHCLPV